jgi:hypothetical protein
MTLRLVVCRAFAVQTKGWAPAFRISVIKVNHKDGLHPTRGATVCRHLSGPHRPVAVKRLRRCFTSFRPLPDECFAFAGG